MTHLVTVLPHILAQSILVAGGAPVKLPHAVIVKAPGLLPMLYTVRELAEELSLPDRTLRDWLEAGAPYQRDERRHIWINGIEFKEWVQAQRKPQRTEKLQNGQAYCLRCKTIVALAASEQRAIKGKLIHIKGVCPQCGCVINRGARLGTTHPSDQLCVGK